MDRKPQIEPAPEELEEEQTGAEPVAEERSGSMRESLSRMPTATPAPLAPGPGGNGILIVCRQERTVAILAGLLTGIGEPVMTADKIQDAWECIRAAEGQIGLVVQDLTAPTLDDFALLRALRTSTLSSTICTLFLVRKEYHPPALEVHGEERVRDGWLRVPCPGHQVKAMAKLLLEFRQKQNHVDAEVLARELLSLPDRLPGSSSNNLPALGSDSDTRLAPVATPAPPSPPAPQGILAGQLESFEVSKLLTVIEPFRLTGALFVNDGQRQGVIHFINGSVAHAKLKDIEGPDALYLLFHMRKGEFHFIPGEPLQERTIHGNTMSILLEGLRQMDEAKAAIRNLQERRRQRSEPQQT